MNVNTGAVYEIGGDLISGGAFGDKIEQPNYYAAFEQLQREATADEIAALKEESLVLVSEDVAKRMRLGWREQERRRRRRKR